MIGGTGLLGSEAAKELIARGHEVSSIALPPLPTGAVLPPEMKLEFGNYLEMSDDELKQHLTGFEGFVFAAGVDERVEGPKGKALIVAPDDTCGVDTLKKDRVSLERLYQKGYRDGEKISNYLYS